MSAITVLTVLAVFALAFAVWQYIRAENHAEMVDELETKNSHKQDQIERQIKRIDELAASNECAMKQVEIAHQMLVSRSEAIKQRDMLIENLRALNTSLEGEYRMYQILTESARKEASA